MEAGWEGHPIEFHFVMDAHAHLGQHENFVSIGATAAAMLQCKERMGIDLTAISSIPSTIGGWTHGNDEVIQALQRFPDRFLGYITINAHNPSSVLREAERCWSAGCRALKLHSGQGLDYDRDEIRPALDFANDKGCPILCHVWGGELDYMGKLIEKYSRSRKNTLALPISTKMRCSRPATRAAPKVCSSILSEKVWKTKYCGAATPAFMPPPTNSGACYLPS